MKIAIVHHAVSDTPAPDDTDVLIQAEAVLSALNELGHQALVLSCTLDLFAMKSRLEDIRPDLVFNLVESLGGRGRLIHLFPTLLDAMGLAYTGSSAMAVLLSSNKILAKAHMEKAGIKTPSLISASTPFPPVSELPEFSDDAEKKKWLIKSVWEHASIGLDEGAVIERKNREEILGLLEKTSCPPKDERFAEAYIEGREFNISLLAGPGGPQVLPPAEIIFDGYPDDKPKIVGYRAKWDPSSYEYHHTPRCFQFPATDAPLLREIDQIARRCWEVFGLGGYARVDFRVDVDNRPWILEINTNPCLSPDAGFAAAAIREGIGFTEVVKRILEHPVLRHVPGCGEEKRAKVPDIHVHSSSRKCTVPLSFRYEPNPDDIARVGEMTHETGFFREDEIQVAMELVKERLEKGVASGYHFIFALNKDFPVGYTCYGPIACTVSSHDLFWIVVSPDYQQNGVGQILIAETEKQVRRIGGTRIYVETSHKDQYRGTRRFYERCGYVLESVLHDFYAPGDGKATYSKSLFSENTLP